MMRALGRIITRYTILYNEDLKKKADDMRNLGQAFNLSFCCGKTIKFKES
jgi:hypothetical protein